MGMKVGQVMRRPVLATSPHSGVRGIALLLVRAGISGMPVTDTEGNIVGIVTEYDLVKAILENKKLEELKAEDIMQKETITLEVEADISEALKIFTEKHILRVPVTENGKLVGILSRIDALNGILEEPEFMLFWEQRVFSYPGIVDVSMLNLLLHFLVALRSGLRFKRKLMYHLPRLEIESDKLVIEA